jgi:hypothetical protein
MGRYRQHSFAVVIIKLSHKKEKTIMKKTLVPSTVLILLMVLSGCVWKGGQQVEQKAVEQIKKGVTTRAEVERLLGSPTSVTIIPGGHGRILMYSSWELKAVPLPVPFSPRSRTRNQMLQINLNKDDIVEDYELVDRTTERGGGIFNQRERAVK